VFVPDLDKFHGQDARQLAMIGIECDRSVIIEFTLRDVNAVKLRRDNFLHGFILFDATYLRYMDIKLY
jgi:hypothetical protein